jgi:hypothetical protein
MLEVQQMTLRVVVAMCAWRLGLGHLKEAICLLPVEQAKVARQAELSFVLVLPVLPAMAGTWPCAQGLALLEVGR